MTQPAILALEDGTVFEGDSVGAPGLAVGEVVFNTAMTGYQEILTDPSYAGQVVTLTYPHIGNVGANAEDAESRKVFAAGGIAGIAVGDVDGDGAPETFVAVRVVGAPRVDLWSLE